MTAIVRWPCDAELLAEARYARVPRGRAADPGLPARARGPRQLGGRDGDPFLVPAATLRSTLQEARTILFRRYSALRNFGGPSGVGYWRSENKGKLIAVRLCTGTGVRPLRCRARSAQLVDSYQVRSPVVPVWEGTDAVRPGGIPFDHDSFRRKCVRAVLARS